MAIDSGKIQTKIQVVDFSVFLDGSAKQRAAEQMLDSFKTTGFVYLTNFGMPDEEMTEMFEWSKRFFSLPLETKKLAPHPESGTHHRGYSSLGLEQVIQYDSPSDSAPKGTPNMKESFESGRENDEAMPNIWLPPDVLPGFREACLNFFWKCYEIEKTILKALALGLGLDEDWFLPYHTKPDNQLRLLHYPSVPLVDLQSNKVHRISGHSDFDTLTILFQDNIGGLEVEDPSFPGKFLPVPPIPGSIVINAGDFLMRWSNDIIRSTIHRVRAPQHPVAPDGMVPARYSIPYFCCADLSTVVDSIPGTWSDERPKKYEPISAMEYVMKRLAANY